MNNDGYSCATVATPLTPKANHRPLGANRPRNGEVGDGSGGPIDTDQENSFTVPRLAISDR
jgi:hypothetical protein